MSQNEFCGTIDPAKIEFHPIAKLFPLLEGAEFEALVEDIRANGLRTPILLDRDGLGLDGRNRLRACLAAGVPPRFETWDGSGSVIELIMSLNLRRRHLNESQRALVAARMAPELDRAERGTANCANLHNYGRIGRAAAMLSVSQRSVAHAVKLLKSGNDELIREVEAGKLAVSAAVWRLQGATKPAPQTETAAPAPGRFSILMAKVGDQEPSAVLLLWAPASTLLEAARLIEQRGLGSPLPDPAA